MQGDMPSVIMTVMLQRHNGLVNGVRRKISTKLSHQTHIHRPDASDHVFLRRQPWREVRGSDQSIETHDEIALAIPSISDSHTETIIPIMKPYSEWSQSQRVPSMSGYFSCRNWLIVTPSYFRHK